MQQTLLQFACKRTTRYLYEYARSSSYQRPYQAGNDQQAEHHHADEETHEIAIIPLPHAVVDKRTVVVETDHAIIAIGTMRGAGWLDEKIESHYHTIPCECDFTAKCPLTVTLPLDMQQHT